jgi:GDPmannose 4,6-dehydratase
MRRSYIITGVTGQDGSLLSRELLSQDHKVYGLVRRRSDSPYLSCSAGLEYNSNFEVVEGDITDLSSLARLCKLARAYGFFNMSAQSHVGTSFKEPVHTGTVTGLGVTNCLEAIRESGIHTRFLQASTSEMYGGQESSLYNESSSFKPRSPYACAKLYGYWMTRTYRESYSMFASNSICFNHEEPGIRGPNFVTRKIAMAVAKIRAGLQEKVYLGNLDAKRDWSLASDVIDGMIKILHHNEPDDFVLASGETHSVREFCEIAFDYAGLGDYRNYVEIDPKFFRPAEVDVLLGDASKAKKILGWEPKVNFEGLVQQMVNFDINQLEENLSPQE